MDVSEIEEVKEDGCSESVFSGLNFCSILKSDEFSLTS